MASEACLEHGSSYTLSKGRGGKSRVFRKDEWMAVTDQEREYLEKHALERTIIQQGSVKTTQFIQKFKFRKIGSEKDTGDGEGGKQTRKRTRTRNK